MAIVVVLVVLIAVGIGVGVALSGKNKKQQSSGSASASFVSPTRPRFSEQTDAPADTRAPSADARTAAVRASDKSSALAPSSGLPKLGYEKARPSDEPPAPAAVETPVAKASPAVVPPAVVPPAVVPPAPVAATPAVAAPSSPALVEVTPTDGPPTDGPLTDDVLAEVASSDDEPDEDLSHRFNPRGARSSGTETYAPTVPRKPVLLTTEPLPGINPASAASDEADEADEADGLASDVEAEVPEFVDLSADEVPDVVLLDAGASSIEDDVVADVVAASSPVDVTEPAGSSVIIDLDESVDDEPVLVLDDGPKPLDEVETADNDDVLKALIGRVRITQDDVDAVATELGGRDDLDADGVAEVLADLAEIAAAEAEREDELTLFSEEVPSRPGQLTRFAELGATERRRVIIRVLCLLVARADDGADGEDGSDEDIPVRGGWPGEETDDIEEPDLPNRVGLVKS